MSTEKPLAVRLLDAFEHFYFENACLRLILEERGVPGWEKRLATLRSDKRLAETALGQFAALRASVVQEGSEEEALQRLLTIFPANRDEN